ncbi:hypothetical protein VCRA2112O187_14060001 [Vibrio crassostreae]|nr:hypothetical protein VCRA2112O187_14060001 [Vibrio crassostreae]
MYAAIWEDQTVDAELTVVDDVAKISTVGPEVFTVLIPLT